MSAFAVERDDRVATVRINRPEKRNALRRRDAVELFGLFEELAADVAVRCVLLGGTGGWLCAGGDLSEDVAITSSDADRQIGDYQGALRAVTGIRVPVVVVLEGAAVGAGAAFALAGDVCVAAPDSRIMLPWLARGLVPDMGVAFLLARQVGAARAKACLLAGGAITAAQAEHWGLVASVDDNPWRVAREWAERIAAGPPVATAFTKKLVNTAQFGSLDGYLDLERSAIATSFGTSEPAEGIAAFVEKRAPAASAVFPQAGAMSDIRWSRDTDSEAMLPPELALRSGDGLSVVTLRGRIVFWNDAAEDSLKIPRDVAVGSLMADVSRTPETWEANWGHHVTTVGAHLSGNPPVRRVLTTRDNENTPVRVHVSSVMLELEPRLPLLVYSFTVEHLPEGEEPVYEPPLGLTAREWEVSCLLMSGLGTSEIASELDIAYATVRAHIRNILVALDANTRTQAMMRLWSRYGIPEMPELPHKPT